MNSLAWALVFSLGINILMFVPAFIRKTDKLTDISYSLTFIAVVIFGFLQSDRSASKILLLTCILLWAARLGTFLFVRINRMKRDKRFDGVRDVFTKFLGFWLLQGLSVFVISLNYLLFLGSDNKADLSAVSIFGIFIFLIGLLFEATADYQKYLFTGIATNKGKWIESGVWKVSRHPNYFGEILVWVGVYIFTFSFLEGTQRIFGLISPIYIIALLVFISGIPPLEKTANKRWGHDKNYQEYKKKTSVLIPFL